jgi:hypothetical protein
MTDINLPNEILLRIFQILSGRNYDMPISSQKTWPKDCFVDPQLDLVSAALVNRRWNAWATEVLYEFVHIKGNTPALSIDINEQSSMILNSGPRECFYTSKEKMINFLCLPNIIRKMATDTNETLVAFFSEEH